MALDPVAAKVLEMIADNQRTQHAENKQSMRELQASVNGFMASVTLLTHRVEEIEDHLDRTVNPWIRDSRDNAAQVRGGFKLARAVWPTLYAATLGLGAWALKIVSAILTVAPK